MAAASTVAEMSAVRRLRPEASITEATVKPSGTLCRKMAKKISHPSRVDSTNPQPIATPSSSACAASPMRTE